MIARHAQEAIKEFKGGYPVVTITGPRQSGKTTLARHLFKDRPYVTFEEPDVRQRALDDPRNFLNAFRSGAVFDEVQRVPELFSYLQPVIDEDTSRCRFVLTGSQQFGLLARITQSLAGRTALVHLLPFALHERYRKSEEIPDLDTVLFAGLYPPVHDRNLDPQKWYAQYVSTYIERDVRQVVNIRDLSVFQRFLRLCAARCGGLLNLSSLASDAGVSHTTAKSWISILEASYILFLLPPHHRNLGKRLVKTPKLYFYDTGLVCWLLSIASPQQLNIHSLRGAVFETFVLSELCKSRFNRGLPANYFFWRDKAGLEIDVVSEEGESLAGMEIKSGSTFAGDFTANLAKWSSLSPKSPVSQTVVYGGDKSFQFKDATVHHWADRIWVSGFP